MTDDNETLVGKSLETTPTWALAIICFIFILLSIILEHGIQWLSKYFNKRRKKALSQALNKIKSELMLFGFISLLLSACEKQIANICISEAAGETFLPCSNSVAFADVEEETKCSEQGKISILSREGTRQLQFLIFVMAAFHSFSCVITFSLGMAKMKAWESWEAETRTLEYQFTYDPRRFRLIHQTSFAKRHLRYWSGHRFLRWPVCFLVTFVSRVFCSSVLWIGLQSRLLDSQTRLHYGKNGLIYPAHFTLGSSYNFQNYIRRALEKDFGVVVGISLQIWMFCVLFIFFNAHAFRNYLWLPFIPLVLLLLVGTKLQGIITKMCLDSTEQSAVVRGTFLVRPSDDFFWFRRPKLLLYFMHFILFQNSFQLAFFTWTWYKFGLRSCFHREIEDIVIRIVMSILVQFLCGYATLPLYALVTRMGASMDKAVFADGVIEGLKRWRANARKNVALASDARVSTDVSSLDTCVGNKHFSCIDDSSYVGVPDHVVVSSSHRYVDEGNVVLRQDQGHHELGSSFHGFHPSISS